MADNQFTKGALLVEVRGKAYAVRMSEAAFIAILDAAKGATPNGKLVLDDLPNQNIFTEMFNVSEKKP
ncbi:hypothetical protein [Thalassospira xiamenensis]|uniref:Uncharacterized protein n=1 Tax=Thalassospira xiamenensis TaxID=220697 RepID=A0A285THC1_9PROT|nr:hypothetical protein [Thalassospira xiamenensis]SOC21580.1 hypothetical protein SAMN05428964_103445 [Thalassospira xiamenensis]